MSNHFTRIFILFFVLVQSCAAPFLKENYTAQHYSMDHSTLVDSAMWYEMKPYRDSINLIMNEVIAETETELIKAQPEGTLNDFLADAVLLQTRMNSGITIDFSLLNYGGMRIPSIAKGNITLGKIFELLPFDNLLVILSLKGSQVQRAMDAVAQKGGWPVSGITFTIKESKATDVRIGNMPLDTSAVYSMVTVDYIANGGDDMSMLQGIYQNQQNVLLRDEVLKFLKDQQASGKKIFSNTDGRIKNAQ